MLTKEKQLVQELLSSPGWEIYKSLVLGDFRNQLSKDVLSAGRIGDSIKSATYVGQIDILERVLQIPEKFLKG